MPQDPWLGLEWGANQGYQGVGVYTEDHLPSGEAAKTRTGNDKNVLE